MKTMGRWLKNWSWAIWNGISPSIVFDVSITDWQWWAIAVPMCLLVGIRGIR